MLFQLLYNFPSLFNCIGSEPGRIFKIISHVAIDKYMMYLQRTLHFENITITTIMIKEYE